MFGNKSRYNFLCLYYAIFVGRLCLGVFVICVGVCVFLQTKMYTIEINAELFPTAYRNLDRNYINARVAFVKNAKNRPTPANIYTNLHEMINEIV